MKKILDFSAFAINEAKKHDAAEDIMGMLTKKPKVSHESKNWPDEKNIYSLAGIKKYFKGTYSTSNIDDAVNMLKVEKKIKSISVKNSHYKENYPYFFEVGYEGAKEDKATLEAAQKK